MSSAAPVHLIHHVEAEYAIGALGPICVMVLRRGVEAADFVRLGEVSQTISGGVCVLSVLSVEASPSLPREARARLVEWIQANEQRFVAGAVVIEGTGLRATIVRSMLAGVMIAASARSPYRVFGEVDAAAAFICGQLEGAVSGPSLDAFIAELFAATNAHRAPG